MADLTGRWLCIDKYTGAFFGVCAHSSNEFEELHGPFRTRSEAETHAKALRKEYADYTALFVVEVTIAELAEVK